MQPLTYSEKYFQTYKFPTGTTSAKLIDLGFKCTSSFKEDRGHRNKHITNYFELLFPINSYLRKDGKRTTTLWCKLITNSDDLKIIVDIYSANMSFYPSWYSQEFGYPAYRRELEQIAQCVERNLQLLGVVQVN